MEQDLRRSSTRVLTKVKKVFRKPSASSPNVSSVDGANEEEVLSYLHWSRPVQELARLGLYEDNSGCRICWKLEEIALLLFDYVCLDAVFFYHLYRTGT